MSSALLNFGRMAAETLRSAKLQPSQLQLSRRVGDLPVKNNPHIENWATFRENVEETFKPDVKTLSRIAVWGVAVPVFLYTSIVGEFDLSDKTAGRKKKDMM